MIYFRFNSNIIFMVLGDLGVHSTAVNRFDTLGCKPITALKKLIENTTIIYDLHWRQKILGSLISVDDYV